MHAVLDKSKIKTTKIRCFAEKKSRNLISSPSFIDFIEQNYFCTVK